MYVYFILLLLLLICIDESKIIESIDTNGRNVYNYGEPDSKTSNSQEMMKQFKVKYPTRKSVTGMFNINGPFPYNIVEVDGFMQLPNYKL